jgi:hypothetical protein
VAQRLGAHVAGCAAALHPRRCAAAAASVPRAFVARWRRKGASRLPLRTRSQAKSTPAAAVIPQPRNRAIHRETGPRPDRRPPLRSPWDGRARLRRRQRSPQSPQAGRAAGPMPRAGRRGTRSPPRGRRRAGCGSACVGTVVGWGELSLGALAAPRRASSVSWVCSSPVWLSRPAPALESARRRRPRHWAPPCAPRWARDRADRLALARCALPGPLMPAPVRTFGAQVAQPTGADVPSQVSRDPSRGARHADRSSPGAPPGRPQ